MWVFVPVQSNRPGRVAAICPWRSTDALPMRGTTETAAPAPIRYNSERREMRPAVIAPPARRLSNAPDRRQIR